MVTWIITLCTMAELGGQEETWDPFTHSHQELAAMLVMIRCMDILQIPQATTGEYFNRVSVNHCDFGKEVEEIHINLNFNWLLINSH